jgi:hypothetical protein
MSTDTVVLAVVILLVGLWIVRTIVRMGVLIMEEIHDIPKTAEEFRKRREKLEIDLGSI